MCFDAYRKVVGLLVYNDSQIPKCQTAQINLGTPLDIFKMLYYKFVWHSIMPYSRKYYTNN